MQDVYEDINVDPIINEACRSLGDRMKPTKWKSKALNQELESMHEKRDDVEMQLK